MQGASPSIARADSTLARRTDPVRPSPPRARGEGEGPGGDRAVPHTKHDLANDQGIQALIEGGHDPMAHHAQVVEPHRVADVDDEPTLPHRVRLGVSGDLRTDHSGPDGPDCSWRNVSRGRAAAGLPTPPLPSAPGAASVCGSWLFSRSGRGGGIGPPLRPQGFVDRLVGQGVSLRILLARDMADLK